jgi:hypothetical protein
MPESILEVAKRADPFFMGNSPIHAAMKRLAETLGEMQIPFAIAGAMAARLRGITRPVRRGQIPRAVASGSDRRELLNEDDPKGAARVESAMKLPKILMLIECLLVTGIALPVRAADSPSAGDVEAVGMIEELGGSLHPMSNENNQEWEVDFHLRGRALTDEGLAHVAALKNVVSLNLRDTQITGAGLAHLRGLTQLRYLHLERTSVGDAGTENLSGLANLEYLNLYGTNVSDQTLARLPGLKKLKRLYVWQTAVTDDGVARLEKELPDLRIVRGVDLSKLPTYSEVESNAPKPTEDLKWIAASSTSEAPKSQNGLNTQVFFANKSGVRVKLYWVSYGNELKLYGVLEPDATRQQNTYSRNTWLITDENDAPLGYFIVTEAVSRAVIPSQK